MDLVPRHLRTAVEAALEAFRVVVVHGARQSGKTTLVRQVAERHGGTFLTLDDPEVRGAALEDPAGLLTAFDEPLVIDEVQLGGDGLVRAVKMAVDTDPRPGRFVLTGSTNFLTVPSISESLAGRAQLFRLWPLSVGEALGVTTDAIEWLFEGTISTGRRSGNDKSDYLDMLCRGGYPEPQGFDDRNRRAWFESYVEMVTQRDIAELADVRKVTYLSRLLDHVTASTAREFTVAGASRRLGVDRGTVARYLEWLEMVFLVHRLPAWGRGLSTRAVQKPKIHLTDSGLAAALLGASAEFLARPTDPAAGQLLETFVTAELSKQATWSTQDVRLHHYRDGGGHEVDLVIERTDGAIVAVEVKATGSPGPKDVSSLAWLRDRLDRADPRQFRKGVLLHTGEFTRPIGDRLWMVPISELWSAVDSSWESRNVTGAPT